MIVFLSLFLGLVLGPQTVSLEVAPSVDRVELLLDGRLIAALDGEPWVSQIDLGKELAPHELVAVAYDREGGELDRARQWLNLPRQPAEAAIVIEGGSEGVGRIARVSWESLVDTEPSTVRAEFDGRRLEIQDPRSIQLPPHDPEQLHFLRVELEFGGFVVSTAELVFGGTYADQVNAELTAVPVRLDGRRKLPTVERLQTWFAAGDRPLRVAAAEKARAEIVFVRDRSAWSRLREIRSLARANSLPRIVTRYQVTTDSDDEMGWFQSGKSAWGQWSCSFLWPVSRRLGEADSAYDVFPHSARYSVARGSLHAWLTLIEPPTELVGEQRLANAVAVAGLTAASSNRRRAVILVLGDSPQDGSDISPLTAARYLDRLQVPLFVWSSEVRPSSSARAWGQVEDISSPGRLERASRAVFQALERQRMIWFDGFHRPQDISLRPAAQGLELLHAVEDR